MNKTILEIGEDSLFKRKKLVAVIATEIEKTRPNVCVALKIIICAAYEVAFRKSISI